MNKFKIMKQLFTFILTTLYVALSYAQPTTGASVPTKASENVVSIYSDTYGVTSGINTNPNWGQAGFGAAAEIDPAGDGNNALAYPGMNYQGIEFAALTNVAAMEYLHVDIWVPTGTTANLKITPVNNGTGAGEVLVSMTYTAGQWTSIDIPKSSFTGQTWDSVFQIKLDGGAPTDVYVDNIYFWKEPTVAGTDATLSDITLDGTSISGFNAAVTSYSVALVQGTTTPPQTVAATATDAANGAAAVVNQATTVPGDATIVVTAADGTTTETYTISFYIGIPASTSTTTPTAAQSDVISIFSDDYTNITMGEAAWNQSAKSVIQIGGRNILKLENCNFYALEDLANSIDFSMMDKVHLDYFTFSSETASDGGVVKLFVKLVDLESAEGDTKELLIDLGVMSNNSWNTVTVDLSTTGFALEDVDQIFFDNTNEGETYYIDNWYFEKTDSASLNIKDLSDNTFMIYPNPVQNTLNVSAGASVDSVSIFDLTGREVLRAAPNAAAFSLDVANLNKGLYLVSLKAGDQEMTTKLVK